MEGNFSSLAGGGRGLAANAAFPFMSVNVTIMSSVERACLVEMQGRKVKVC